MTDECISPLRQRMIEDMSLRHFGEKTQKDYIRAVKTLTIFLGRSPDTATAEDLRLFQLHLTENRVRPPSINFTVTALRFFFTVTLDRADAIKHLTFVAEPRKIPVVLSREEVARFLEAAPGVKYKAAFSAAYGAGPRVSEVAALKVSDINSERMLLRIEQGNVGDTQEHIEMILHWQGGDNTAVKVKKNGAGKHRWTISEDTLSLVRDLARLMPDRQIARLLNRAGKPTGRGNGWTQARVCSFRSHHGIAVHRENEWAERGEITLEAAAQIMDVSVMTALRMVRHGIIKGRQVCRGAPWVIKPGAA